MSYKVQLHAYDLSGGMARLHSRQLMQRQIDGVWNTGVVVYGKEFYFGNGICYDLPSHTPYGQPSKTIDLGITEIPEDFLMQLMDEIKDEYTLKTFNVVLNNANNFSDRLANLLLGKGIPQDILNQAQQLFQTQVGQQMAPLLVQAQQSLMLVSNPLFTEGTPKFPLKIKNNQKEEQPQQPGQMDPNILAMMEQFGNMGNQNAQTNPQLQRTVSLEPPKAGEIIAIQNQAQLSKLLRDNHAVIIDFWSAGCAPCMRFKPIYEGAGKGNKNKHIIFTTVDVDSVRDVTQAHNIRSIPQFTFYLNGKEHAKLVGADEHKFRQHLGEIHKATMSKAGSHFSMSFKQFKPMNRLPVGYTTTGQIDKMREFISKLVAQSPGLKLDQLKKWLVGFDIKQMGQQSIDQLVALASTAEDKSRIALVDLLRLIVLDEDQAEYIFGKHWGLVDQNVIEYIESTDLKDKDARVLHNYHLVSFKFLTNAYQTASGRRQLQDYAKGIQIIQFCTRSFLSCNPKTVLHASLCLFNHLLCFQGDNLLAYADELQLALKAIDEVLSDKESNDPETILAVLLCECRILYSNPEVCSWVEETFKDYFAETHNELKRKFQQPNLNEAIADVLSMVDLESKK